MPLFFGLSAEKATLFAVKCLAVGGAFLFGFVLVGALAALLDRWLFGRKTPPGVKRVARLLGGLAAAVFAALALFGSGGDGLLGGGTGDGPGPTDGSTKTGTPSKEDAKSPVRPPDTRPSEGEVRVTILGGNDVKADRFYLVDDDPMPKTFAEAKAAVGSRTGPGRKKLTVAVLFPSRNAVARDHPAVTQLARWANEQAGLDVNFPAP